jgi:hypothetical protein
MKQALIEFFAVIVLPLMSIALPVGLCLVMALWRERTTEAHVDIMRRYSDDPPSELASRIREFRSRRAGEDFKYAGLIFTVVIAAEAFVAANWFSIGRAIFRP